MTDILSVLQAVSSLVVIAFAAAGWPLYKFFKLRVAKKALRIVTKVTVVRHLDRSVVLVRVFLTNIGTVLIKGKVGRNPGCKLYVKSLADLSSSQLTEPDRLPDLVPPIEYLGYYYAEEAVGRSPDPDPILLEPRVPCEVKGCALFSTDYKGPVLLLADFMDKDDYLWRDPTIITTSGLPQEAFRK